MEILELEKTGYDVLVFNTNLFCTNANKEKKNFFVLY